MKIISGLLFVSLLFGLTGFAADTDTKDRHVQIEAKKNGNTVALYAHLTDCTEATITLTMSLENMTASPPVPLTVDSLGKQDLLLTTIHPTAAKKAHKYSYQYHYKIGRRLQFAPIPFTYALPYVDHEFKVLKDSADKNEHAVNWEMPNGTTVCTARSGVVACMRQDSDDSKGEKNKHEANYVVIKHEDNSFAEYCNLKKNSLLVALNQKVKANEPLGLSGGSASSPYLHFSVYYTIDGKTKKTLPVQFATKTGNATLKAGGRY